jgi:hypothetical protein
MNVVLVATSSPIRQSVLPWIVWVPSAVGAVAVGWRWRLGKQRREALALVRGRQPWSLPQGESLSKHDVQALRRALPLLTPTELLGLPGAHRNSGHPLCGRVSCPT